MKNRVVHDSHVELTLVQSKTDIYWRGIIVVIAKTRNDLCPVTWLKKYVQLTDLNSNSEFFLCRSLCFLKSQKCINWIQIIVHCPNREQERFYWRLSTISVLISRDSEYKNTTHTLGLVTRSNFDQTNDDKTVCQDSKRPTFVIVNYL
jgi:hypothetical protein